MDKNKVIDKVGAKMIIVLIVCIALYFATQVILIDFQIINKNLSIFHKFLWLLGILVLFKFIIWIYFKVLKKKGVAKESILDFIKKKFDLVIIGGIIFLIIYLDCTKHKQYTTPLILISLTSGFLDRLLEPYKTFKKEYSEEIINKEE